MKVLKRIFLVLFFLIVLIVIGLAVFIKTFDVNKYKSQITQKISENLGRDVDIGNIALNLSLKNGITLDVDRLTIADDSKFSTEDLVAVQKVYLNLDLMRLIKMREISISKVLLSKPVVHFVKNDKGEVNLSEVAKPKPTAPPDSTPKDPAPKAPKTSTSEGLPEMDMQLDINSIEIKDGKVIYRDQTKEPGINITVHDIDLDVDQFSLNESFSYKLSCSLFSSVTNIFIDGKAIVNPDNKQVRLDDVHFKTNLSNLAYLKLGETIPALKDVGLQSLNGILAVTINQAIIGSNSPVFALNGELKDGSVETSMFDYPLDDIQSKFEMDENNFRLKSFAMKGGKIQLTADVTDYLNQLDTSFQANIQGLSVYQVTRPLKLPVEVQGRLFGNAEGSLKAGSQEEIMQSLAVNGQMQVQEGRLVNFNVLRMVLSKLSMIPNLMQKIEAKLSDKQKERLYQTDTLIAKAQTNFSLQKQVFFINQAEVDAQDAIVLAHGQVDMNKNLNMNLKVNIPTELSNSFVDAAEELGSLVDQNGQINIPFKPYQGPADAFRPVPDVGNIGQAVIKGKAKSELKDLIFKELDLDQNTEQDPNQQPVEGSSQVPQTPQEASPEKILIDNVLNSIFN